MLPPFGCRECATDRICKHEVMDGRADVTPARVAEVARVIDAIEGWARSRPDIVGAAVVGSWARGAATMASDLDVVLLTTRPAVYLASTGWWGFLGAGDLVATERWGVLDERRIALRSGPEIEFGITEPSWAQAAPPDPGTLRVVRDGMDIIFDRDGLLERLVDAAIAD